MTRPLVPLFVALLAAACGDSPTDPGEKSEECKPCPEPECTLTKAQQVALYKDAMKCREHLVTNPQLDEGRDNIYEGPAGSTTDQGGVWSKDTSGTHINEVWFTEDDSTKPADLRGDVVELKYVSGAPNNDPKPYKTTDQGNGKRFAADDTMPKSMALPTAPYPPYFDSVPPGATVEVYKLTRVEKDGSTVVATVESGWMYRTWFDEAGDEEDWIEHFILHDTYKPPQPVGPNEYELHLTYDAGKSSNSYTLADFLDEFGATKAPCNNSSTPCSYVRANLQWKLRFQP